MQMATRASTVESVSTPKTEWNANVGKDMEDRYVKVASNFHDKSLYKVDANLR